MSTPGAAMSLNWTSRFENAGEPPVETSALTPSDVRQRRRPARVRPRLSRGLIGVPDCRDDEHSLRDRVRDRVRLELRVRIPVRIAGVARPPRLMLMMRAPFATAQRIAFASASTGSTVPVRRPLRSGAPPAARDQRFRRRRSSGPRSIPRRTCRAPVCRPSAGPATKLFDAAMRPWNSGMRAVDTRVDHGDPNGGERGRLGPEVERAVLGRVPLPRRGADRSGRTRCAARRAPRRRAPLTRRAQLRSERRRRAHGSGEVDERV